MLCIKSSRPRSPNSLAKGRSKEFDTSIRLDLARRLHETLAQDLALIGYCLDEVIGEPELDKAHRQQLRQIRLQVSNTTKSFRDEIYRLRVITRQQVRQLLPQILNEIDFKADLDYPELEDSIELALNQVILEIARNSSRHSRASYFSITFEESDREVKFEIRDNGVGGVKVKDFNFGLSSIDELLKQISGSYSCSSDKDGTSFRFQIKKSSIHGA